MKVRMRLLSAIPERSFFPLIHLLLQIFITVPEVITGTFSGISQHPSKALLLFLSTVRMRL